MGNEESHHLANIVNEAMVNAGISVNRLAGESGIPRETLRRKLAGHREFVPSELRAVARIVGASAADWMRDLDARPTSVDAA